MVKERVEGLRRWLKAQGFGAFIVTTEDAHQSEYVSQSDKRREWISGFTGSQGTAVILQDSAVMWVDGRYTLQASKELDPAVWTVRQTVPRQQMLGEHLNENLPPQSKVALDGFLMPLKTAQGIESKLKEKGNYLVHVASNPVDEIWEDRPPPSLAQATVHPNSLAGEKTGEKLVRIRAELEALGAEAMVVTALDEVAWLLNLRGKDVDYNPVVVSYCYISKDECRWYVDSRKVPSVLADLLSESNVTVKEYSDIAGDLSNLRGIKSILVDPAMCSLAIYNILLRKSSALQLNGHTDMLNGVGEEGFRVIEKPSPLNMMKSVKNEIELNGIRNAHLKDAAAMCQFICWLEHAMEAGEKLNEFEASAKVEYFRSQQDGFLYPSFETISSYGANGAIIHYAPEAATCANLGTDRMYLCDSGGQYRDGTTDITRTMHFGTPTQHEKECYTRVLKGHIALSAAVFPEGTTDHKLDILARTHLWEAGLDYKHGTGHGVGAYLCVHEGPQLISYYSRNDTALRIGMTSSIEPGYYEEGEFGIRIENVAIVTPAKTAHQFSGLQYLTFEPIALVPLSAKLIEMSLLTGKEVKWINNYHQTCWDKVSPRLDGLALEWLKTNTQPLSA